MDSHYFLLTVWSPTELSDIHYNQGAAFRGKKFHIFLEKGIIDVKHHFQFFLKDDSYIIIFFAIYGQGNISFILFVIFVGKRLVLVFDPYNFRL